jgi:hypothetical protein
MRTSVARSAAAGGAVGSAPVVGGGAELTPHPVNARVNARAARDAAVAGVAGVAVTGGRSAGSVGSVRDVDVEAWCGIRTFAVRVCRLV